MRPAGPSLRFAGLALLSLIAVVALLALRLGDGHATTPAIRIGLFTSLPLLFRETPDVATLVNDKTPPHWALGVLRAHGQIVPLDSLAPINGTPPLGTVDLLIVAQPRPLSPAENVALDDWVRSGGRVLLFVDPMLTAGSSFALGDPRRPQDVAMLSPILARWGLELRFDEAQEAGQRVAGTSHGSLPVNLPGSFARLGANSPCDLSDHDLVATCAVGRGHVLALADAALLEQGTDPDDIVRARILSDLIDAVEQ